MAYVPLWTKSNHSFLEGASHPGELVEHAHALGLKALALTDRDGAYGLVRAYAKAKELGLKLIYGAQVTVGPSLEHGQPVIVLAQDRIGYGRMCQLLSSGHRRCPKGQAVVSSSELMQIGDGTLVLCPHAALLGELREAFAGRLYALCARHRHPDEPTHERRLRSVASELEVPTVAAVEVLYHCGARRPLQDVLTCIRLHKPLAEIGTSIRGNAEHALLSPYAMSELFADDPAAVHRTVEIAERCEFSFSQLRYRYPAEKLPVETSEIDWLRHQTLAGARQRYAGEIPSAVRQQLEHELALIHELDYGGYFLTMWEIVQFCRKNHILCQGRGSAANSAVCYCLGITAIDPVRMDLLFERFLSRERAEPPDIDLDIEHQRREEVIQWVYERYGRRHAAMVANVIRYRARSAVRDVGKALGLPQPALDRLAKLLNMYDTRLDPRALEAAGLSLESPVLRHFHAIVDEIADFPRHLSIHPGGFLLGHEPVDTLVPIEPATMEGRTVVQWDKYDVEELGLFKVDLLGLGALSMIRICFDLLREHESIDLTMASVPGEDPATYEMISNADTVGVFQIESRAQMAMLPRLQPRTFYDLVIEVAIVRPGPIQGDMVHPYLQRRSGREAVDFPHPSLRRVLANTLGVPIFQEQVMKLAMLVADYSAGEADQLRRDMAAWRSAGRIERHRDVLIGRMVENGISREFAHRIFEQICGFGEYGFPESHAASFALIAYITAWLRCHHLAAFTCALLNAQPMGFYSTATIVEDAKRHGIDVRPVDVSASGWDSALERTAEGRWAVRMGFRTVKGLGERERPHLEHMCLARPFASLSAFVRDSGLGRPALLVLAETGALGCFGADRRAALWAVRGEFAHKADAIRLPARVALAREQPRFAPLTCGESILWDYRTAMHSTRGHPLEVIRDELNKRNLPVAADLAQLANNRRVRYVGLVICRQRPGTASGVTFYTLEDETGFVNLVVWRQVFERYPVLAKSALLLGVSGKIQAQDRVVHLVAEHLWDPDIRLTTKGRSVRDFH